MSLCTLPAPVNPDNVSISPRIDVVLLITESHLMLCRRSGQQVWSTRLPHTDGLAKRVASVSWSPDGRVFALLFLGGSCTIYDVSNGRPLPNQQRNELRIASVAWTATAELPENNGSAIGQTKRQRDVPTISSLIEPLISLPSSAGSNSFAAVGTLDGKLRISVYGALNIDEIALDPISSSEVYLVAADEQLGEYAAVQGTKMYIFRATRALEPDHGSAYSRSNSENLDVDIPGLSPDLMDAGTHSSALSIQLGDTLHRDCEKLLQVLEAMARTNRNFFQPFNDQFPTESPARHREILKLALLSPATMGEVAPELKAWMSALHEQGFKKWYSTMSQHWDSLLKLLIDEILVNLERLTIIQGQLEANQHNETRPSSNGSSSFGSDTMNKAEQFLDELERNEALELPWHTVRKKNRRTKEPQTAQRKEATRVGQARVEEARDNETEHDAKMQTNEIPTEELTDLAFEILSIVSPQRDVFEAQATYLEHLFREEIDRPIAVARKGSVNLSRVAQTLVHGGIVGEVQTDLGREALKLATAIQTNLDSAVAYIRAKIRSDLKLACTVELNDKAEELRLLRQSSQGAKQNSYALILQSGKYVIVDANGAISHSEPIEGFKPTFTGTGAEIISLDSQQRCLILPNKERGRHLGFEPATVVARQTGDKLVACVLSEDFQHYEFVDVR